MSYILDALRRADAERERDRGGAPGLHSTERLLPQVAEADEAPVVPPLPFARIVIGVLGTALAGAGTWWYLQRAQEGVAAAGGAAGGVPTAVQPIQPPGPPGMPPGMPPVADPAQAAIVAAGPGGLAAAGPSAGPLPGLAGTPMAGPAASGPPLMPQPRVLPDPPGGRPPGVDPRAPTIQPQLPGQGASAAVRARAPGPAVSARPVTAPVAAAEAPLPRLRDLPESTRKELPALAVSGSMYSPQPASRMVVLDGQVLREGQSVAPGLTLEQIGPRSAILGYKGQRFELPF